MEARNPDTIGCPGERYALKRLRSQSRATHTGEDKIITSLARHMTGKVLDQEPWHAYLPPLMSLSGSKRHHPMHRGDTLSYRDTAPQEVHPADPQCGHLTPPQARIGQEQRDQGVIRTAQPSQLGHLSVSEVAPFSLLHTGSEIRSAGFLASLSSATA